MRTGIITVLLLSLVAITGCTKAKKQKMELRVLSEYVGSEDKIISDSTTVEQIEITMNQLDWNGFEQVLLSVDDNNWIEVSGSLKKEVGFSSMYSENGNQYLRQKELTSVKEMTEILISYLNGETKYKRDYVVY